MPDPINIDPSALPTNVPDNNVAHTPTPGVEKLSLGEFENYTPTGQKPVLNETGTKLAKEQPAIKPQKTEVQKDSELNKVPEKGKENVSAPKEPKVEEEEVEQDQTSGGEEDTTGEDEVENEDGESETSGQDKGEADKGTENLEGNEKIHGNSKRDYSGFSQDEIKVLKKLDNSRFAAIAPRLKVYKEAAAKSVQLATELESAKKMLKEGGIPEQWHQHPEAYQLSKEFQDINTLYSYQEQAENHYQQQLINIKQGKPWTSLQWDKVNNQFIPSGPHEASDQGEVFVQRQLIAAANAKQNLQVKSETLRQGHEAAYQKDVGFWKDEVDKLLAGVHPDVKPIEADEKLVAGLIPKRFHNDPMFYALTKFGAMLLAQGKKLKEKYDAEAQVTRLNQDVRRAGTKVPPKRPSSPAKSDQEKYSMKDFGDI